MNKSYKSVWNESTGSWVAVSELATGRSKSKRAKTAISKAILTQIAVGGMGLAGASIAMAGDPVKLGTGAVVNVADGVAIGTDAEVDADFGANAGKTGGVAIGNEAYSTGSGVSIGQNSSAGSDSMAMGDSASATLGGTAIGQNARSFAAQSVALGQNASAGGQGSLALGANSDAEFKNSTAIGQGATTDRAESVSVGSATIKRQITNVAAGTADTDATNVSQLKALGASFDTSGHVTNTFVSYDTSAKDMLTLGGASGTKITNLTAGAVSSASKDAVNGSQLFAVAQSAAAAVGGSSTVGVDGKITKPVYTVSGNTYTSLDSALSGVASMVSSGGTGGTGGGTDPLAVHYSDAGQTSVNLGVAGTPVKVTNVAAGVAATDAVNKSQLDSVTNSIAPVASSLKFLRFGASTAQVANAMGNDSLAIGGNAFATQNGSVAIGLFANASGVNSISIGTRSSADGKNSVAIGSGSSADDDNVVSVGSLGAERRVTNVATGTATTDAVNLGQVEDLISKNANTVSQQPVKSTRTLLGATVLGAQAAPVLSDVVAVGTTDKYGQSEAMGTDAIAMGLGAHATNDNTVAIGTNVAAGGVGGVAIGNLTTSGGVNATAIGINAQSMGDTSVAIGTGVKSQATNSVAIGDGSNVTAAASNGIAIGYKNTVTGVGTVVLGNQATATGTNSVVLGSGSDGSQSNVVSVGAKGTERKIVNVAAGTTTTDAVNLGQMSAAIAAGMGSGGGDGVQYDTTAHASVTFGGTGAAVKLGNVANGSSTNDAVNFGQLSALGGKVDSTGKALNAFVAYDDTSMNTITLKGTAGTTKITQLTNGALTAASSDAVNGSQLFNTASTTAAAIGGGATLDPATGKISKPSITVGGTTYDNIAGATTAAGNAATAAVTAAGNAVQYDQVGHTSVTLGGTGAAVKLTNVANGTTNLDAVNFSQLSALGGKVDSTGKALNAFVAYDDTSMNTITLKGAAGTTKITKLTAGTVNATSTDAVNGTQLFNTASTTAAAIGGGATVDPTTGKISTPTFKVGTSTYDTIAAAFAATGGAVPVDGVAYDSSAHDQVTFGGTGKAVALKNVAAGVSTNDAVNMGQLTAMGIVVDSTGKAQNSFVAYDDTSMNTITLKGAAGTTKITKLTAGALTATSTDAVNGSQLFNTASSAADAIGGGATLDPATGKISKPSITVGGTTYDNLAGATTAAGNAATQALTTAGNAVQYDGTTHTKVTLGGTGATTPVTLTNVANGVNATDAVNKSQLDGVTSSVNTIAPALKYLRFGSSTAQTANAIGTDSLAIGGNAFASQTGSVAIGLFANVSGLNSVAIGSRSSADGQNSVALGAGSSADDDNVVSVGSIDQKRRITNVDSGTSTTDAVNLGQVESLITAATKPAQQVVKSTRTLVGAQAAPVLSDVVAVGTTDKLGQAEANGTDAVAIGLGAHANNDNTVAIGTNVAAGGVGGVAIGNLATSGGVNATAIGINAQSMGDTSVAIGNAVKSQGTNTIAIGNGNNVGANAANSIAIGYKNTVSGTNTIVLGSQVTVPTTATNSVVLGNGSDGSQSNVVSVGAAGTERKIVNVAAGTTTTDAVNLGQMTTAIKTAVVAGGGSTLITQAAAGDDLLVGGATQGAHVNFAGTGVASRELINVSAGTTDTSAVNVSQLKPVVAALGGGAAISAAGVVTGPSYSIGGVTKNNVGDAFTAVDTNLSTLNTSVAAITAGGTGLVVQDPATGDINVGALLNGNKVNFAGKAGDRVLTGVADGAITGASSDAVNGKQIAGISSSFATAIGGGSQMNTDGSVTIPTFTITDSTGATTVVHNVGDAISNLDTNITKNYSDLSTKITNITNSGGVATPNAVAYDSAVKDTLTLGDAANGVKTKLTNLQDGDVVAGSTDAVTGGQLYETKQDVAALQNSVQNIAATGSTSIGVNGANGADGQPGAAGAAGATGADAIAMGDTASASGDHSVVIGGGATASGDGTTVIGGNGSATGANSTAIGSGSNATGANSVALGAGSVADRDNSVSVGSDGHERQITNVAAGTQGTDAVNLNQMNSAVGGIARKAYSGIAAATALTMIPDVDANKTLSIGIGGGTFQGYAATAIGGTARITQNIKVRVGAGWSAAGTTVGAGASYQW